MALFHEGIGVITASREESVQIGERVVIVPNISERLLDSDGSSQGVADNYAEKSVFFGERF